MVIEFTADVHTHVLSRVRTYVHIHTNSHIDYVTISHEINCEYIFNVLHQQISHYS